MLRLESDVWRAFEAIKKSGRPIRLDVLTGFLGVGFASVIGEMGVRKARVLVGLDAKRQSLPGRVSADVHQLPSNIKVRTVPGLHAKIYLFDDDVVAIGSANLTKSGFERLRECLVVSDERRLVQQARRLFRRLWRSSRVVRSSGAKGHMARAAIDYEAVCALGTAFRGGNSPFSTSGSARQGRVRSVRQAGAPAVRICAYAPHWLMERDSFANHKAIGWTTGAGVRRGDLQLFCVSTSLAEMSSDEASALKTHPSFDAVHSIWRAKNRIKGNAAWPIQANFELVARLRRPVPKAALVRAGILVTPRWPEGCAGKLLRDPKKVRALVKVLTSYNPTQRQILRRTFGDE